jgi:hypothetical protein
MGIEVKLTSPALCAGLGRKADRRDGATAPRVRVVGSARGITVERGDPITLSLAASRLDLSREAGEVS